MPSLRVLRVLHQLGEDIRTARKKRRIPVMDFAARLGVTEGTLARLEKGEPGVRMETFAMALLALGELDRLEALLDPGRDDTGLMLEREKLPKRIDRPRRKPSGPFARSDIPEGDDEGTAF